MRSPSYFAKTKPARAGVFALPWTRADTFSIVAIAISIASASASIFQARVAKRKEAADREAKDPIIDPVLETMKAWPPGFVFMSVTVRNRSDYLLSDGTIRILKPSSVYVGPARADAGIPSETTIVLKNLNIPPAGSTSSFGFDPRSAPRIDDARRSEMVLYVAENARTRRSFTVDFELVLQTTNKNIAPSKHRFAVVVLPEHMVRPKPPKLERIPY